MIRFARRASFLPLALVLLPAAPRAGTPLPGFTETVLVPFGGAGGVNSPVAVAHEPGTDNLWILEKGGGGTARIRVRDAVSGAVSTLVTLPGIDSAGERGLLGIAFDPDWDDGTGVNRLVYLYYTSTDGPVHNRVSRFFYDAVSLVSEQVLLEGPPLTGATNHNGGTVRFGADETLYVSMGDNDTDRDFQPQFSQDLSDLRGKILRINKDGTIPADNPFVGVAGARPEIWAHGLRNPFRFSIDPLTDVLYIGDVGEVTWESVQRGIAGANHGYPCWEGPAEYPPGEPSAACPGLPADPTGVTFPIYWYGHGAQTPPVQGASITGGPVYRATAFPPRYHGRYFFADYGAGWIRSARIDVDGRLTDVAVFVTGGQGVTDMAVSPAGCLTYVAYNGGGIREVCYTPGANERPTAVSSATPRAGLAPLVVQFTGSASSDPDGDALAFDWQFGDGGNDTAPDPSYAYAANGTYEAVLTVDDQQALPTSLDVAPALRIVVGNEPPAAGISAPPTYVAGQPVAFSGTATDPEDGMLGPGAFEWIVERLHAGHAHPVLGPARSIDSGSFTPSQAGECDLSIRYRVHLQVTDSGAPLGATGTLATESWVDVDPARADVTLDADPSLPGVVLRDGGTALPPPVAIAGAAGCLRDIGAPTPQAIGPRTLTFERWSDGDPAADRALALPEGASTLVARFLCNVVDEVQDLRVRKGSAAGLVTCSWAPVGDPCLQDVAAAAKYRVWTSATARPAVLPGTFPVDPPFAVAATSDVAEAQDFDPGAALQFLLVTAVGRDDDDGPSGHYPTP